MTTVSPEPTRVTVSAWTAVVPVSIIPLACSNDSVGGLDTTLDAGTTTSAAYAPRIGKATTSSPTCTGPAGPSAPPPTPVTTPAASNPRRIGNCAGSCPEAPLYIL